MRRLVDSVRVRLTFAVTVIFAGAVSLASVLLVRSVEATLLDDLRDRNAVIIEALRNTELASNDLNDTENLASDLTRAGHGADELTYERETENPLYFQKFSVPGYAFGINTIIYSLTH